MGLREVIGAAGGRKRARRGDPRDGEGGQSDGVDGNAGSTGSATVERGERERDVGFIVVQSGDGAPCPIGRDWFY